ncbi:hypothetical protein [Sphingomonas psychrotolerans]|uniref:DUF937 domain-containing protein n=1 Tax=Sphingomonas psychrotolerans TaxID=1327635 RepID=A0A2K8MBM7_9SPHN|nr:hypothetical protein [Sphingomonas psychrotolerans]ATY31247.1 hypothetical protein CVN68_04005 [Sphingomonas psychrotolerans]
MSILDGILGQITQNVGIANLANKVGLSPEHVESAVQALAKFHPMEGDTAEGAASATGLPVDKIREIIGHIGGEGSLGRFSQLLEGDALGKLGGLASGLFGKN